MDELKTSVQAASFEQKDPLVIYKMEAYELFEGFIYLINEEVTGFLSSGKVVLPNPTGAGRPPGRNAAARPSSSASAPSRPRQARPRSGPRGAG